jgi:DNA polymerase-4
VVVEPHCIQAFLDPLPVGRSWGVGRVTAQVLERLGVRTIGHVRELPQDVLRQHFGEHGNHLWQLAHGQDHRPVVPDRDAKSVSHETTFARDIEDIEVLRAWVMELADQVACRLRRNELRGRTVHLKVRFGDFHTITRAHTLPAPTNVTREICDAAVEMLCQRLPERQLFVRLLGVGVSGFDRSSEEQRLLFDVDQQAVQSSLDKATDQIRERFGPESLSRASGLLPKPRHQPTLRPNLDGR